MLHSDYGVKPSAELSEYQKRIENIENVILCVSEAEKMIEDIGLDLVSEDDSRSDVDLENKFTGKFVPIRSAQQESVPPPLANQSRPRRKRRRHSGKDYGF
ncbi:hypothetical protein [Desulfomonile tiedjei]|uniref:Uncharacterized protein n=1 Tax=Desulfomonile tiedjei (strain ATCC 49306 / DSM 6799 / DCB-1) TaxID=706587 RepID=I4CBZ9_DESTA|nr:hypothetical protein [Desulfomonile tiedjei]AFM27090.1 hypothetical protein Desti_4458 [Desulfomonile tiedjei DSM 6799]